MSKLDKHVCTSMYGTAVMEPDDYYGEWVSTEQVRAVLESLKREHGVCLLHPLSISLRSSAQPLLSCTCGAAAHNERINTLIESLK